MQRTASAAATILLLHAAASLRADDVSVQLFEVAAGVNGDSRVQLVQLKMVPPAPKWGPQGSETEGRALLVFHDASGAETGRYIFPGDPPAGIPDSNGFHSVLIATAELAALPGSPAPDFILPARLIAAGGGKVCFGENPSRLQVPRHRPPARPVRGLRARPHAGWAGLRGVPGLPVAG